jgi:hypothetical protein
MPPKALNTYTSKDLDAAKNKGDHNALKWAEKIWAREQAGVKKHGAAWETEGMGLHHSVNIEGFISGLKRRLGKHGGTRRRRGTRSTRSTRALTARRR